VHLWAFFVLQQPGILQQVLNALLLLLHDDPRLLFLDRVLNRYLVALFLQPVRFLDLYLLGSDLILLSVRVDRGAVAGITVEMVEDDDILFLLDAVGGGLDGVVPAFLALALVKLAGSVDLLDNFAVDANPGLAVELLFLEHREVEHLILDLCVGGRVPLQAEEVAGSQLGLSLNCSSQASTIL
jgi:hypothetical protein